MKTFGKIDILVLNAGVMGSKTLAEIDEAFFDSHFDINVKAPLFMAKAAAAILPARESSRNLVLNESFLIVSYDRSSGWSYHILFF